MLASMSRVKARNCFLKWSGNYLQEYCSSWTAKLRYWISELAYRCDSATNYVFYHFNFFYPFFGAKYNEPLIQNQIHLLFDSCFSGMRQENMACGTLVVLFLLHCGLLAYLKCFRLEDKGRLMDAGRRATSPLHQVPVPLCPLLYLKCQLWVVLIQLNCSALNPPLFSCWRWEMLRWRGQVNQSTKEQRSETEYKIISNK